MSTYEDKRSILDQYIETQITESKDKLNGFTRFDPENFPELPLPKGTECYFIDQCRIDSLHYGVISSHQLPFKFNVDYVVNGKRFQNVFLNGINNVIFYKLGSNIVFEPEETKIEQLPESSLATSVLLEEDDQEAYNNEFDEIFQTKNSKEKYHHHYHNRHKHHKKYKESKKKEIQNFECQLHYEDGIIKRLNVPKKKITF